MACGLVSATGQLLASERFATAQSSDPEALFAPLEAAGHRLIAQSPQAPRAIGVGCGGPMRYPAGIVSPLNIPGWREFPLRDRLIQVFNLPCIVDNDAK